MLFISRWASHGLALAITASASAAAMAPAPPAPAAATEPAALTLTAAVELALKQHPELQALQYGAEAAQAGVDQAGRRPNPAIAFESEDVGRDTQTYAANWIQPLELGGKRARRVQAAASESRLAELALQQKRLTVAAQVRRAFIQAALAQQQWRNQQDNARVMQEWAESIQKRVDAGKSSPLEAERATLAAFGATDAAAQAQREWSIALNQLATQIGQDKPPRLAADEVALIRLGDWEAVRRSIDATPAALAIQAAVERAEAELAVQRSRAVPDLQLSAGVKNYRQSGANGVFLGLSIPLPLADRNQDGIRQTELRLRQARAEAAARRRELETRLGSLWEQLLGSQRTLQLYDDRLVPGAERTFAKAGEGYRLGKFAFLDMLDAQRSLIAVRAERYQTLKRHAELEAEFESLIGPLPAAASGDQR